MRKPVADHNEFNIAYIKFIAILAGKDIVSMTLYYHNLTATTEKQILKY